VAVLAEEKQILYRDDGLIGRKDLGISLHYFLPETDGKLYRAKIRDSGILAPDWGPDNCCYHRPTTCPCLFLTLPRRANYWMIFSSDPVAVAPHSRHGIPGGNIFFQYFSYTTKSSTHTLTNRCARDFHKSMDFQRQEKEIHLFLLGIGGEKCPDPTVK
jgi:hypothetical protein